MKRFIAFGFDCYYPSGGLNDRVGEFDTFDEARAAVTGLNTFNQPKWDDWQVLDVETGEVVEG